MTDHEEILAPLREKYGEIASWNVPGLGLVVAASPNPQEYERLVNELNNPDADKAVSLRNFAISCVVYPEDRETVKRIFQKKPAFATKVARRGQQLCGSEIEELGKGSG